MSIWNDLKDIFRTVVVTTILAIGLAVPLVWAQVGHRPALSPAPSDAIQYVSPNGSDANDGLSMGTAKLTLTAAKTALPANGGTISVAAGSYTSSLSMGNGVIVRGDGINQTTINVPSSSVGFDFPSGTYGAGVEDLTIVVNPATSSGITMEGNIPMGLYTQFNTIRDVVISSNRTVGVHGIWAVGTASIGDVSLNRFENVRFVHVDLPVVCSYCEGDTWSAIQIVEFGYSGSQETAFNEPNAYNEHVQLRLSANAPAANSTAYFSSGFRSQVDVYCEAASAVNLLCIAENSTAQNSYRVTVGANSVLGSPSSLSTAVNAGGVELALVTKSSPYTLATSDSWINVTGTTTITVPHALTGQRWDVFNSGAGTVTIQADSGNVNGAANITIAANVGKSMTCDGTNCFAH